MNFKKVKVTKYECSKCHNRYETVPEAEECCENLPFACPNCEEKYKTIEDANECCQELKCPFCGEYCEEDDELQCSNCLDPNTIKDTDHRVTSICLKGVNGTDDHLLMIVSMKLHFPIGFISTFELYKDDCDCFETVLESIEVTREDGKEVTPDQKLCICEVVSNFYDYIRPVIDWNSSIPLYINDAKYVRA